MAICRLVGIGASAGGVKALQEFFMALPPESLPVAYLVVIHMSKSAKIDFDLIYGHHFPGKVQEIFDKAEIKAGNVYFAPAGYHVLIEKNGCFSLTQDELENFARPSIDVSFSSLSAMLGRNCCGVLMTGSNGDGAEGLKQISEAGGYTIVQDPKFAEHSAMPEAALELFKPDAILGVPAIASRVAEWARGL